MTLQFSPGYIEISVNVNETCRGENDTFYNNEIFDNKGHLVTR